MQQSQLHGRYDLQSLYGEFEDGSRVYPFGERPNGCLDYRPDGYMSVFAGAPDRPKFAGDVGQGSPEEIAAAFGSFDAYCGRYTINPEEGTITHHVTIARLPDYEGSDQTRYYRLQGEILQISTAPFPFQGRTAVFHLLWKRAST